LFKALRREPGFYRHLFFLTLPIVLQNLITIALGFVDTFMVGLLGNAEMAAVNAANTPIFVLQMVMFGSQSGLCILVSQYWGKGDQVAINRCLGAAACVITAFTSFVALVLFVFPTQVMTAITPEPHLVAIGRDYLRIVGVSYVFNGLSSVYSGFRRSTEDPLFGMKVMAVSMTLNTALNYVLIFGKLGFAPMGVVGAAAATLFSRVVEFLISLACALRSKRAPLRFHALLHPGKVIWRDFFRYATPVACNEALWSLGISMLVVIIGHMDNAQDMLAAHALVGYIEKFTTAACIGIATATAVIVGKEIGAGESRQRVHDIAWSLLLTTFGVGTLSGAVILALVPLFFSPVLFPLFDLTPGAAYAAKCMICAIACFMPVRSFDITNITGIFRAGGDVRASTIIDLVPLWFFAVPLCALSALVLEVDVVWACIAMHSENLCKMPVGLWRFHSDRWINNLTVSE